jgi:LysM repeat protein
MSPEDYIKTYKDLAVKEMERSGIPASITLAQGMLESENGNSKLARKANNHFGIKCHSNWTGPTIRRDDDKKNECFRKYRSVYDSYQDHSDFLMSGQRYAFLFELNPTDYKSWAKGLKKAGYATSPTYAELLIRIIEENNLHQYDLKGKKGETAEKKKKEKVRPEPSKMEILPEINRVKYIIVKPEDTFKSIREKYNLLPFEIYKYNNLKRDQELTPGQVIFLQPKRNRAEAGNSWHTVKKGETMEDISQKYAVKVSKLYLKNNLLPGTELKEGQKISLRKKLPGPKTVVPKQKKSGNAEKKNKEEPADEDLRFEFDE